MGVVNLCLVVHTAGAFCAGRVAAARLPVVGETDLPAVRANQGGPVVPLLVLSPVPAAFPAVAVLSASAVFTVLGFCRC